MKELFKICKERTKVKYTMRVRSSVNECVCGMCACCNKCVLKNLQGRKYTNCFMSIQWVIRAISEITNFSNYSQCVIASYFAKV